MNIRESMLLAIESRLIPRIVASGFIQHALSGKEKKSREIRMAFPFGRFKRRVDADLHLVEIQLGKYDSAKFVLNFGSVPPGGVTLPWVHLEQDDVDVSALPVSFRLYSKASSLRWFSLGWFPINKNTRIARAVEDAVTAFSEVEDWFATNTIGKHIRQSGFPITGISETM